MGPGSPSLTLPSRETFEAAARGHRGCLNTCDLYLYGARPCVFPFCYMSGAAPCMFFIFLSSARACWFSLCDIFLSGARACWFSLCAVRAYLSCI